MILFTLFVAVVNFVLGYAAAVHLGLAAWPILPEIPFLKRQKLEHVEPAKGHH